MTYKLSRISVILLIISLLPVVATATRRVVTVTVSDGSDGTAVEFAGIAAICGDSRLGHLTDRNGQCTLHIDTRKWDITATALGYSPVNALIAPGNDTTAINIIIYPRENAIGEVIVTARESAGMSTASVIDRTAMGHLQPSSFTDLLQLLPGNISSDPVMGSANLARLRTATNVSDNDNYNVSSLGTAFIIDGVPVNTNADMSSTPDATQSGRMTSGKGVDMRSISTDDIESVEIVRGIASAEYGEMSSGIINIRRKSTVSNLEARFKADMLSQLFYLGKGIKMPGDDWVINLSADYLDSKIDPRNSRENFKRVTGSVRNSKKWRPGNLTLGWNSAINYSGTFERDINDPDLTINNTIDKYTSDKHSISLTNALQLTASGASAFRSAIITSGISYSNNHLHQEKTVASSRLYPMPVSITQGDNYVGYLPMMYESVYDVYGKPFTAFVKGDARFSYNKENLSANIKVGVEWNMSKNYGEGAVYDLTRPLTAGNTARPRPFNDIPAMHLLSFYAEQLSTLRLGTHSIEIQLGLRETQMLHLDRQYYISLRPYLDPRVNIKWSPSTIFVGSSPLSWSLNGGIGLHTKMPVASMLYPDKRYSDFTQLNYFHNEETYRTMNVKTYVEDLTNYDLRAARNLKWEIGGDITFMGNRLSVTLFRENMTDGFRNAGYVRYYTYRRFDANGFDPYSVNRAPVIDELPYTTDTRLSVISAPSNSSLERKSGIEYTFSSRRIPAVRTRITVSGAWFRTTRYNSEPLWYKPSIILNNKEMFYAGLYDDRDGMRYESCNTNFTFDTDVPRLKLNFSVTAQTMWYSSTQTLYRDGVPTHYVGTDGVILPFTDTCADDPYLKNLIRSYSATAFERHSIPFATSFNIKATKRLWNDRIGIALYVNRLLDISPAYKLYGVLHRRYTSPYFGMELNIKL